MWNVVALAYKEPRRYWFQRSIEVISPVMTVQEAWYWLDGYLTATKSK